MEKEQDFFANLPKETGGLVFIAAGLLQFIGAYRRWKWMLDMTGERSAHPLGFLTLMQDLFGEDGVRIGIMIMGLILILCGVVLMAVAE